MMLDAFSSRASSSSERQLRPRVSALLLMKGSALSAPHGGIGTKGAVAGRSPISVSAVPARAARSPVPMDAYCSSSGSASSLSIRSRPRRIWDRVRHRARTVERAAPRASRGRSGLRVRLLRRRHGYGAVAFRTSGHRTVPERCGWPRRRWYGRRWETGCSGRPPTRAHARPRRSRPVKRRPDRADLRAPRRRRCCQPRSAQSCNSPSSLSPMAERIYYRRRTNYSARWHLNSI